MDTLAVSIQPTRGIFVHEHQDVGDYYRYQEFHQINAPPTSLVETCWEGIELPFEAIKARYDINWERPIGRGGYGKVLEVSHEAQVDTDNNF
jgi:hypothetical protein